MNNTSISLNDLLADMRVQVQWRDKATMPIPLYERMKAVITRQHEVQQPDKEAENCIHMSRGMDGTCFNCGKRNEYSEGDKK